MLPYHTLNLSSSCIDCPSPQERASLDSLMAERLRFWRSLTFPYGSEMSWDNTGGSAGCAWCIASGLCQGRSALSSLWRAEIPF